MPQETTNDDAPPILELRQYLLQPGRRDDLIELFDREFVETQEAVGIDLVGQFRDLDRPDYFVWLRRFDDMESRRQSLAAFYGGPVWAQHRDAANSTMVDSDDVLLLRPVSRETQLVLADRDSREHHPRCGAIVALIMHRQAGRGAEFNAHFESTLRAKLDVVGARTIGLYQTEPAVNTFPRLPVRDANVLVWFGAFDMSEQLERAWQALRQLTEWLSSDRVAGELSTAAPDVLRLTPTSRSLLDGMAPRVPESR
jgi:NIPSNAP